ncbi:MAG: thioredoxin family protein [Christensenella sp.]
MSLFGKKDKKVCDCGGVCNAEAAKEGSMGENAAIKILGSGCEKCKQLEANTVEALRQLGMNTAVEHVTDFAQIASYGVMSTPAIVYNDKVLSYGKVLKTEKIVELIKKQ